MERERKRARLVLNAAKTSAAAAQAELALFEIEDGVATNSVGFGTEHVAIKPEKLAPLESVTGSTQGLLTEPSAGLNSTPAQFIDLTMDHDVENDDVKLEEEPAERLRLPGFVEQHNHSDQMSTSQSKKDNTVCENAVKVGFNGYATMTVRKIDCNTEVQQHSVRHSSDEPVKEGLLEEVNADASILSSERDEHSVRNSKGNCGAENLEAQGGQLVAAIDKIPCPFAASYRCELSFGTDGLALLHARMHLDGTGRYPCRFAIRRNCSRTWLEDYLALLHSRRHTKETRKCPGCRKTYCPPKTTRVHQRYCTSLQAIYARDGGEAKWKELPREMPGLFGWELEHAYYSQEAGEWKVR